MMGRRVVIVGGGFGGVAAAQAISRSDFDITLIDRRNFHLFQPLLYQVAMAGLNPSDIAIPLRTLFRRSTRVKILLAEVSGFDFERQEVQYGGGSLHYDYLVISTGVKHDYFGNESWESRAPGLKTIEQAIEIRRRVLTAFERAESKEDESRRQSFLTFVVVGGGPTGVELAGAIAEMVKHTLMKDYKNADLRKTRVVLVEAGPRVLPSFPESLSRKAAESLRKLGVEVLTHSRASDLSSEGLRVEGNFLSCRTILWAAGVKASNLSMKIPGEKDRQGRLIVESDLSLPTYRNVFAIGDLAHFKTAEGNILPGLAPVALQEGAFLAEALEADRLNRERPTFHYRDRGILATIGRSHAVAHIYGKKFSGLPAWLAWVFVHIFFLMRVKNRFFVFLQWAWAYFTFGRGARLITYKTWRFYAGQKIPLDE